MAMLLGALSDEELRAQLLVCCASERWVDAMLASDTRPFASAAALHEAAASAWAGAGREDRLQAFAAHPRIGEQSLREKFGDGQHAKWASGEQAGAAGASAETIGALAANNDAYFARFGYVFLVCATGKTAEQMLELLLQRLPNDDAVEIDVAAAEQAKITDIRLDKLLAQLEADEQAGAAPS